MEQDVCSRRDKNIKIKGAEYCSRCLVEIVEKRVKRQLSALVACKIALACADKKSLQCKVAAYIVKRTAKQQTPITAAAKNKAVVTARCADEIAAEFIWKLTAGSGSTGTFGLESKAAAVNIFESVTEKELELYATIKKIKYGMGKSSKYGHLRKKIQAFQARHPGTIEALAKSGRQLGEL